MSGFAQEKITIEFDSELSQALHFFDQTHRIHHDAVADNTSFFRAQNAGRHKVQNIFLSFNVDRVAGVITALRAHNDIGLLRQYINDFAFAFIAPLGANQNRIRHNFNKNPRTGVRGKAVNLCAQKLGGVMSRVNSRMPLEIVASIKTLILNPNRHPNLSNGSRL